MSALDLGFLAPERSSEMTCSLANRAALLALFCLLALTGCKDAEKEKALADAKAASTNLAEVKTQLESVKGELTTVTQARDQLQTAAKAANTTLAEARTQLESVKGELATVTQARDQLQTAAKQVETLRDQVTQLAKDKDAALAKAADALNAVDKLKSQIEEQVQRITGLQEQNKKLQQLVDDLKKKLGDVKLPGISIP
jgi:chromosome segregation ATPase